MPPETPKRSPDKSALTPSFTFGLGNLPSFRFTSPRALNILNSLSPHRFFFKNAKDSYNQTPALAYKNPPLLASTRGSNENDTTFELAKTSDSVELWSLADDSQNLSMNLTSINEESDKDVFLSPNEFLFGPLFAQNDEKETPLESVPKKRKLSVVEDSPCKKLASCIETLKSPQRGVSESSPPKSPHKNKVWTSHLDHELLRCHAKYSAFKALHSADPAKFKYTSQNKILSRMLLNKTGILRSAKQISTRLLKLVKNAIPRINNISDSTKTPPVTDTKISTILASPQATNDTPRTAQLQKLNMSFNYLDAGQGSHIFTTYEAKHDPDPQINTKADLQRLLPNKNNVFLRDWDQISGILSKQKTSICNVCCQVNFNSDFNAASSPVSPMSNPRQFTLANGNFLSSLLVNIPTNDCSDSCRSLVLSTVIYKGTEKVLHRSKEMINGFLNENQCLDVEVPFMSKFWSGYLSYLSNGTQDYQDLENLIILQAIHEKDKEEQPLIFLVFTFAPAKTQHCSARVSLHLLQEEDSIEDEADELETMVVSSPALASSPFVASPAKRPFRVNTTIPENFPPAPTSAPIYNSNLLQTFSKATHTNGMQAKAPIQHSKSATFLGAKSYSSTVIPQGQHVYGHLMRHSSAGQIPTNASMNGMQIQGNHFGMIPNESGLLQQTPLSGPMINAPPMAYFHHPQPSQFASANNAPLRQNWVPLPKQLPTVQSAPPSQLGFTTMNTPPQADEVSENKPVTFKQKSEIVFGPIILYDPSRSVDHATSSQTSDSTSSSYQHRFSVPPRDVFQPHNVKQP